MTACFRTSVLALVIASFLTAATGCGKPTLTTLKGNVKLNGQPVPKCKVSLFPDVSEFDPERHGFGSGICDENGNYEILHPQGGNGIFPGTYKVMFVLWIDSKGKVLPHDTKPSEVPGGVKNKFPEKYENLSTTPERVTVPAGGTTKDFNISS